MIISTKHRFYVIAGLLILLFCIGYIELAVFINELSQGAEKVQKAAYIEKDVQKIKQDFWKLRFWERAVQTQSHVEADQQFGETIARIRQQLANFNPSPFDEHFLGKTEPVNTVLTQYENAFNSLIQLETDQRLSQTQIESSFQVLSSTILMSSEFSLLKPLLNLGRFLDRYVHHKTDSEHKALRMVFASFENKLKQSEIINDRIRSYLQKLDELISRHFTTEKKIQVIHKQFDALSQELMNRFTDISQTAENIGYQSLETGSQLQESIVRWMIISVTISLLILLFILDLIARKVIKPIRSLWAVVMKVQSGDEQARFQSKSKDEIAHLGFALNNMLDTINQHRFRLEEIVDERTEALTKTNEQMRLEIEQRKKAQEMASQMALEAEIANKAKSVFLANMSHEIRTPMNAVINLTELVLETQLTSRQREYLTIIKSSGNTLLGIINDILDLSKIESGKMELEKMAFNLQDVFHSIADMFRGKISQKGIEFIIHIAANVPLNLIGDPLRLKQIIVNLTNNAIKFTDTGEIFIQVIVVHQTQQDTRLVISVQDTGIGISQEGMKNLFTPFTQADSSTTRKYGGTGLGLTICKQLAELMGGKIWAETQEGKGSHFSFTASFGLESSLQKSLRGPADIRNKRIVLVDDNPHALIAIDEMIQSFGCITEKAHSGDEAIMLLQRMHVAQRPVHAIFWDKDMPDLDGRKILEIIRNKSDLSSIPVILMGDLTDAREYSQLSADYIAKPVMPRRLSVILDTLFTKNRKIAKVIPTSEPTCEQTFETFSILLVEDNVFNRHVALEILKQASFTQVDIAENGRQAIEALEKKSYDLILMDVQMPEMDGIQATQHIRSQPEWKTIPIIAMTANALKGDREACVNAGMNDYISKPIDRKVFIDKLKQWGTVVTK
ncbi:MAG: response regulator [Candidatus Magnetomorum sp.]|nr:response regulator [Candidatus Magnetomorum sp.]